MNNAALFEKNNYVAKRDAIKCLDEFGKKIQWEPYGDRILDIGCGGGGVTNILKTKYIPTEYRRLVGCDISENMINFAREHYADSKTEFHVLDIQGKVPETFRGNFDHVVSFTALHWAKNQEAAFKNIHDLLADNGDCLLLIMPSTQFSDVYRILSKDPKWSEWVTDVDRYISPYQDSLEPAKEITQLMEKIGFKNIEVTCKPNGFVFDDQTKLKNTIAAINPFNIPKERLEAYLEDYMDVIININRNVESNNVDINGFPIFYRVLDIGCGGGGVTHIFKTQYIPTEYSRLVGCDISENMINFAKEHYADSRTEFHVADIQGNVPETFRENFDRVINGTALGQKPRVPEKTISCLMEKIGFKNIEATCKPNKIVYGDVNKLKHTIVCINPFNIPEEKMEAYLEDFTRAIRHMNRNTERNDVAEGHVTVYYKSLIVYARK